MATMTITLEIIDGPNYSKDDDGWEHNAYTVRLQRDDKTLETPWKQGLGITDAPNAPDVLESLLLDASGFEDAIDFEDWAESYGYDADSRKAEAIYRAIESQTTKLRDFFGDDYDEAVRQNSLPD